MNIKNAKIFSLFLCLRVQALQMPCSRDRMGTSPTTHEILRSNLTEQDKIKLLDELMITTVLF